MCKNIVIWQKMCSLAWPVLTVYTQLTIQSWYAHELKQQLSKRCRWLNTQQAWKHKMEISSCSCLKLLFSSAAHSWGFSNTCMTRMSKLTPSGSSVSTESVGKKKNFLWIFGQKTEDLRGFSDAYYFFQRFQELGLRSVSLSSAQENVYTLTHI